MRRENDFIANTSRDRMGRYTVALPFGDNKELLGDSVQNAIVLKNEISQILADGGFNLRKCASNSREVLEEFIRNGDENEHITKDKDDNRTLGLIWISDEDTPKFSFETKDHIKSVTKRAVLSTLSKVFDLLGLLTPLVIQAK
ncbi:hypothetical protein Trydic_g17630 [Trypoxylus dichotomus]